MEGVCGRHVELNRGQCRDCHHHPGRSWLEHSFRLGFRAFNNKAEYEALLVGMRIVLDMGVRDVEFYSDSRLIVIQVQGRFEARDSRMKQYLQVVKQVMNKFHTASVAQIPWG